MAKRFRGLRYFLAPPWLTGKGDGDKIAYTLEAMIDVFVEKLRLGLEARMPSRAGESAIKLITGDRGLLRGRSETNATLAERLTAWRTPRTHKVRGNAYEALQQIWAYWGGIDCATIDAHGLRHVKYEDGSDDRDFVVWTNLVVFPPGETSLWDDTDVNVEWSRFWVVLTSEDFGSTPDFGDPDLWGGAVGTPGYLLGMTGATVDDVTAMRQLFQELHWGPGHAIAEWAIISPGASGLSLPAPDGNWLYWGKDDGGTRVPARVVAPVAFTHGSAAFRNGAGTLSPALPATITDGSLLLWNEGREDASAFDAVPTGWTVVHTEGTSGRVLVRNTLATESEASSTVSYPVTGAGDHIVRISAAAPPAEGWNASGSANVSEVAGSSGSAATIPLPDNAEEQHRLAFVQLNHLDVGISVDPTDPDEAYAELYDNADLTEEIGLSMHSTAYTISGATLDVSSDTPDYTVISLRLVYNLSWRFWSLDPERNNNYPGYRSRPWPAASELVDGSVYAGDRTNTSCFSVGLTLPDMTVNAGSRTRFPVRVLLLDDGSVPK